MPGTELAVVDWQERGDVDLEDGWRELARILVPDRELVPHAVVEAIDPGVDEIPANLLRFSVTFSCAMEEGSVADHIRLLDDDGSELQGALLAMPPELWDRGRRRLTVLLEPGRIKRGARVAA